MTEITNFIEEIVAKDLESGKTKEVVTRFPPEPNGYLHLGHAKSLCLNFGIAKKFGGKCNLRFDDTNPVKEDEEYVESIKEDIRWLGFEWDRLLFASDYFDIMYDCACKLIRKGKAYVCDETAEEIRLHRGTLTEAGRESPYRDRSTEENLDLFRRMKEGEFPDGSKVLRAKIDMASPNINLRDPVLYRIVKAPHHNTGDKWCIYPMYDFAHPIEDAVEGVTHSICTLEFEDHRPLYDWVVNECGFDPKPQQIEFARLNVTDTVMSKRFLKKLVEDGKVMGWDDPRMPTLCGIRRRGFPPEAIRDFCDRIGVAKANSEVQCSYLESCVREYLNFTAKRVMAVTDPIRVELTNYEGTEELEIEENPNAEEKTCRKVTFSPVLYIDGSDFEETPPPKYFRLKPDGYVRLKGAYIIHCDEVVKEDGKILCLKCSVVKDSRSGSDSSGMKVKGVIQWVDASNYIEAEIREFAPLLEENPDAENVSERFNPESMTRKTAYCEKCLEHSVPEERFQFLRLGYFATDRDSTENKLVFNKIVGLKDGYQKNLPKT